MVIKQGSKSFAITGSHRQTSRIVDTRLAIEHRWRTSQTTVNEIKSQTCGSQRDTLHTGAHQSQLCELTPICRLLHQHGVTSRDQELRGKITRMLSAVGNNDLLRDCGNSISSEPFRDDCTQYR